MKQQLTIDPIDARALIEWAIEKANDIGVPMCIAVVDASCNLLSFVRMDGGKHHSANVAMDKAYTAASAKRRTVEIGPLAQPGGPLFGIFTQQGGRFCIVGGGVPLMADGHCVGAIGISSGTVDQDISVAEYAVEQWTQIQHTSQCA